MEDKLKSEGECLYCGHTFSQKEMTKHLASHLKALEKENKGGSAWHLKIEADEFFLHLLVSGNATF